MENIKISIIIPVYNTSKYLDKCLMSVIKQNYQNTEIVLVNDGSTDNSDEICKKYSKKYKNIKYFSKENEGLGETRNKAVKIATGDYLFFLDSDDFIEEGTLKTLVDETDNGKIDVILFDYYKYIENDNSKTHISLIPFKIENKKTIITSMPTASCKLIKKEIFVNNNLSFPKDIYFEDNAMTPYMLSLINTFKYIQKPLYYYVQHQGSILNQTKYNKKWEEIFTSLEYMENLFRQNNTYDKYYEEIEYIYIEYLLHASNLKLYKYQEAKEAIIKTSKIMKDKFPNWKKNKYFKMCNIKYQIICKLFYKMQINIIKLLLKG